MQFSQDFTWGVATASYQVEGAANEDGRGRSWWDDFCDRPGAIQDKSSGAVACDHYHRYTDDVALMKQLGVQAYRFSISWSRVLPEGTGRIEKRGLDFYGRLVDRLLAAGITPYVTLYHWDLPSALAARGGWQTREIADWFADYSAIMARALGDRVQHWMTINEPWCIAFLSHEIGEHAPGMRSRKVARQVAHHTLIAHGKSVQALRASASLTPKVGIALNFEPLKPLTESAKDITATQQLVPHDPFFGWFATPILHGYYALAVLEESGADIPEIKSGDMALAAQKLDYIGVNYYTVSRVKAGKHGVAERTKHPTNERTLMDWEVCPDGLYGLLLRLQHEARGQTPIFITENGNSFADKISKDGRIHDTRRIAYIRGHIDAVRRAIQDGADVRGYFVWSLMDNFEWARGYQQFFGLVHTNYATQKRTIKDSGYFYQQVIAQNGLPNE